MASEPVLEAELHTVEHELRRIAQVVVPGDERIANHDLALSQDPVRQRQIIGGLRGVEFEARKMKRAPRVAPDRKARTLDNELLQPQLEKR